MHFTLPNVKIVTRFENVAGGRPESNSLPSRLLRKAIATFDGTGHIDYQFRTLLRDSDSIVLLSGLHQPLIEQRLSGVGKKCVLIPPPANMCLSPANDATREGGRQILGVQPDEFVLAYIGFVYPGKGLEALLHAFRRLASERMIRLVIVGGSLATVFPDQPSYLETLQTLAKSLGIGNRVTWTGEYRWDDDRASTYLRAADACVLPFDTGVKLNNSSFSSAAAHGLPIVTTTHAALEPQFVHGENVFLCEPRDPAALASAVAAVVDNSELRARLREGALRLARDWYSWETAIDKTLRLFGSPEPPSSRMVPPSVS